MTSNVHFCSRFVPVAPQKSQTQGCKRSEESRLGLFCTWPEAINLQSAHTRRVDLELIARPSPFFASFSSSPLSIYFLPRSCSSRKRHSGLSRREALPCIPRRKMPVNKPSFIGRDRANPPTNTPRRPGALNALFPASARAMHVRSSTREIFLNSALRMAGEIFIRCAMTTTSSIPTRAWWSSSNLSATKKDQKKKTRKAHNWAVMHLRCCKGKKRVSACRAD